MIMSCLSQSMSFTSCVGVKSYMNKMDSIVLSSLAKYDFLGSTKKDHGQSPNTLNGQMNNHNDLGSK